MTHHQLGFERSDGFDCDADHDQDRRAAHRRDVDVGELEEDDDSDSDTIEGMIAYVKQEVVSGDVNASNEEELKEAIEEASEEFGIELSDDQIQKIASLILHQPISLFK